MAYFKIIGPLFLLCTLQVLRSSGLSEEEVICPEANSYIRHPDCRFYYYCIDFVPNLVTCNRDSVLEYYFSPEIEYCVPPYQVPDCIDGTNAPVPTAPTTTELSTITTPASTVTSSTTTTVRPTTTTTTQTTPTTTTPTTTTTTTAPEPDTTTLVSEEPTTESSLCPPEGVHTFPHPDSCSLYVRCFDGVPFVLDCSPLMFDRIDLECKPAEDAVCDDTPRRCPAEGYAEIPHDTTCSKYFVCFDGDQFELDCAANTYFDETPTVRRCNLAELALCNSECPRTGIHYLPIRARPCKWYKICIEGYSTNVACADGQVHDPEVEQCVSIDAYTCPFT